jgi:hypothetical protein
MINTLVGFYLMLLLTGCFNNNDRLSAIKAQLLVKDDADLSEKIPEYYVDSCLSKFLISIVKSNTKYKPSQSFYSLTWKIAKEYRYVNISSQLWESSEDVNYKGVIKLDSGIFLCEGDFKQESIFHKKTSYLMIKRKIKNVSDTSIPIHEEPVIYGIFYECKGLPIYFNVYTKNEIPEYKMNFRN